MSNPLLMRRRTMIHNGSERPDYFRITPTESCVITPCVIPTISPFGGAKYREDFSYLPSDVIDYMVENFLDWNIEYSINGGGFQKVVLWETISLQENEYIEFRYAPSEGVRSSLVQPGRFSFDYEGESYNVTVAGQTCLITFRPDVTYFVSGNIMSLLDASCNSASIGANYGLASFFRGDDNLLGYNGVIEVSELLADYAFAEMFSTCRSLVTPPIFRVIDNNYTHTYNQLYANCSSAESYDFSTLDASGNVFKSNTSAKSLTIRSIIPPIIGSNTITGLASDCNIYVPAESVDTYKQAQYWSDRASYIFELDENGEIPE